jgi:hypothetical protein
VELALPDHRAWRAVVVLEHGVERAELAGVHVGGRRAIPRREGGLKVPRSRLPDRTRRRSGHCDGRASLNRPRQLNSSARSFLIAAACPGPDRPPDSAERPCCGTPRL